MAKSETKSKKPGDDTVNICRNRRATHDYTILDTIECGIVLVGTEVKSLREGHAKLEEAYGKVDRGEVFLVGCEIPEYVYGHQLNHKPKRERKLLLHKREIAKFATKSDEQGFTLVPLRMYFRAGKAKVELAVAKGKQTHDKRHALKDAESRRDIERALARKRRE